MYRIIHLALTPHPIPSSQSAIDYACRAALYFGAKLTVTSPHLSVRTPRHVIAGGMMAGMARDFERDAAVKSAEVERYVRQTATNMGIEVAIVPIAERWPSSASDMTWRGRTSDLCILGLPQSGDEGRLDVEDWIFGVGRPCLIYPDESGDALSFDSVLISWDFSKSAARAVCDALPILKTAHNVRVLTVRGEKDIPVEDIKTPILELLTAHDVKVEFLEVELGDHSIGRVILDQALSIRANLLVMGAYGHSRIKEFVLGGATKEILNTTRIPLFMSH
ncbi:MAG: putative UspA stress protein [Caulobacteraceae bacterium]|nr:MAG: putative UspA stress protein [Caulobacteraceae bacterium]